MRKTEGKRAKNLVMLPPFPIILTNIILSFPWVEHLKNDKMMFVRMIEELDGAWP